MDSRALTVALLAVAIGAGATPLLGAQGSAARTARARVLGVFNQAGEPVEGAEVTDVLTKTRALTTKTGTVSLAFLGDSGSVVRVQKIGFRPVTMVVSTTAADTVPITVVLDDVATVLPTVVTKDSAPRYISPGLRAFEERRALGFGRFVTEAELRKHNGGTLTNVIRNMGLKVSCRQSPVQCFAQSPRGGCKMDVYLDGAALVNLADRDLEKMQTDQFGAIEAYFGPATVPPLYNRTGDGCAVLLLWSRER